LYIPISRYPRKLYAEGVRCLSFSKNAQIINSPKYGHTAFVSREDHAGPTVLSHQVESHPKLMFVAGGAHDSPTKTKKILLNR